MTIAARKIAINVVEQGVSRVASKLYATSRLKELREAAGMTQQEFVGMLDIWLDEPVSLSTVQKWEQGQRPINPDTLLEIAKYFKVEPKELVVRRV